MNKLRTSKKMLKDFEFLKNWFNNFNFTYANIFQKEINEKIKRYNILKENLNLRGWCFNDSYENAELRIKECLKILK